MSDSSPLAVGSGGTGGGGSFDILAGVLLRPGEAFAKLLKRPALVPPLVLLMALHMGFTTVWLQKVDLEAFLKARLAESPRTANLPSDQRAQIVAQQEKFVPIFAWLGPLSVTLGVLIIAAALLFVFRFFYASEVTFRQAFAVTTWASAATSLVAVPLMLLTLYLKDDWTLNPQEVLQANPSLFLERGSVSTFLFTLLTSLDLFSLWTIALLAVGFGLASRRPFGSAVWGVAIPWALFVVGKAALAGMFG